MDINIYWSTDPSELIFSLESSGSASLGSSVFLKSKQKERIFQMKNCPLFHTPGTLF